MMVKFVWTVNRGRATHIATRVTVQKLCTSVTEDFVPFCSVHRREGRATNLWSKKYSTYCVRLRML